MVISYLLSPPDISVFDMGCGTGVLAGGIAELTNGFITTETITFRSLMPLLPGLSWLAWVTSFHDR